MRNIAVATFLSEKKQRVFHNGHINLIEQTSKNYSGRIKFTNNNFFVALKTSKCYIPHQYLSTGTKIANFSKYSFCCQNYSHICEKDVQHAIFDYLKQQIRRSSQQLYTFSDPPVRQTIVDNINKLWAEINHILATKNQGNQLLRPPPPAAVQAS